MLKFKLYFDFSMFEFTQLGYEQFKCFVILQNKFFFLLYLFVRIRDFLLKPRNNHSNVLC